MPLGLGGKQSVNVRIFPWKHVVGVVEERKDFLNTTHSTTNYGSNDGHWWYNQRVVRKSYSVMVFYNQHQSRAFSGST